MAYVNVSDLLWCKVIVFLLFYIMPPVLCRYHEMMFIIETCQAVSMYRRFYSPNILAVASSQVGEDSLSVS